MTTDERSACVPTDAFEKSGGTTRAADVSRTTAQRGEGKIWGPKSGEMCMARARRMCSGWGDAVYIANRAPSLGSPVPHRRYTHPRPSAPVALAPSAAHNLKNLTPRPARRVHTHIVRGVIPAGWTCVCVRMEDERRASVFSLLSRSGVGQYTTTKERAFFQTTVKTQTLW